METQTPIADLADAPEECPACGDRLAGATQARKPDSGGLRQPPARLQTAYELASRLTFDVPEFDGVFSLSVGDRVCVSGGRDRANLIVSRLWVRALLPRRHGGIAAGRIVCIDAGNRINLYQCVSFARQYGMDTRSVLRCAMVSRAFTIYQLAGLVVRRLAQAVEQFGAKAVIILDLLKMFMDDPQIRQREAEYLMREIMFAISQLPADVLVLVSLYDPQGRYSSLTVPAFNKRIEVGEGRPTARLFSGRAVSEFSIADADLQLACAGR